MYLPAACASCNPDHCLLDCLLCVSYKTDYGFAFTKGPDRVVQGNRGFAYAVLYAAMNVASLLSGWTLDLFRITLRDGFGIKGQPADSVLNSGYRLYLVLGMPPELP